MTGLRRRALGPALLSVCAIRDARADSWPTRSVTWIVPFTPGGITDTTSRLVGQGLAARIGQQVVIENRPGAGGSIGTEAAARSAPDGHTILYGTQGTLAVNPVLYRTIRYDPQRDLIGVHGLTWTPNLVVANPNRPFRDMRGLVAHARAHPGEVTFATSGIGTGTHLAAELFQIVTSTRMTHVPYNGSAPALNDLASGRTDIMFDYVVSARPHIEAGRLRPLAITGRERLSTLPEVPTIAEAGFPEAESGSWSGIYAPAATPAAIVARMARELGAVLSDPRVRDTLGSTGGTPLMLSGQALREHLAQEILRWREIIERAGIRLG